MDNTVVPAVNDPIPFSVVLLSGGMGLRMGGATPKQYLEINGKPIALHSFELFLSLEEVKEIIVVCHDEYQELFLQSSKGTSIPLRFAAPGLRRQDSLFNAMQLLRKDGGDRPICIHDAARPFIKAHHIRNAVKAAANCGAAVLATRVKSTIKVCDNEKFIVNTPDRETLWEAQTPQVIRQHLLEEGFAYANEKGLTVTDDVSLVELIGKPVQIVEGCYSNIKITTPEDLAPHSIHFAGARD